MWVRNTTLRVDPLLSYTRHRRATAHQILASLPANQTLGVGDGVAGTRGGPTLHSLPGAALDLLPPPAENRSGLV